MPRVPILVILGATGSGKSRLGIELAQRFSSEVISADSMQVYKGLDIITAKVTKEEKMMVPHHMLDLVDPLVNYCVIDFRDKALSIMNDLVSRRKMPIIVGGTNYYIESLLWRILVEDPKVSGNESGLTGPIEISSPSSSRDESGDSSPRPDDRELSIEKSATDEIPEGLTLAKKMKFDDDAKTNEELHRTLHEIDPEMARRLHPNNRRKIIRSLEVFSIHGTRHSEILEAQRTAGGSRLGGPLRYPDSIIFWLRCDQKVLDERLNRRVDSMLEAGLVDELLDFHARYNEERLKTNTSPDYTKGIFQSIGFKEFHNYLQLPKDERNSERGEQLLKQGIDDLKMVTRRYARRQQRWVMNRFIKRIDRQVPPIYGLDCTNVEEWNSRVLEPAIQIVEAKLRNEEPSIRPLNEDVHDGIGDSSHEESRWCEICNRVLIGALQWNDHIKGAKHYRVVQRKKKQEALQRDKIIEEKLILRKNKTLDDKEILAKDESIENSISFHND